MRRAEGDAVVPRFPDVSNKLASIRDKRMRYSMCTIRRGYRASPNDFLRLTSTGPAGMKRRNLLRIEAVRLACGACASGLVPSL